VRGRGAAGRSGRGGLALGGGLGHAGHLQGSGPL
jgi:hypothetical protein